MTPQPLCATVKVQNSPQLSKRSSLNGFHLLFHSILTFFVCLPTKGRGSKIIPILEGDTSSTTLSPFHQGSVPQLNFYG